MKLKANKTKLIALCREMGYRPTREAEFTKAFRDRSWWLEWGENGTFHRAHFFIDWGRVLLGVEKKWEEYWDGEPCKKETWHVHNVTNDQISRLGLVET